MSQLTIYKPQLVHKCPPKEKLDKLLKTKSYIATTKIDGYFASLVKDNTGIHLYSRAISKKTGFYADNIEKVPHIRQWAEDKLPNGVTLIGEIYVPCGTSKDVTTILGALPPKAIERQKANGYLNFWLHDILAWEYTDYVESQLEYGLRYSKLCEHIDLGMNLPDWCQVAPCYDNTYCDLQKVAERIISEGGEGIVCVDEHSVYKPGARTLDMFKIKRHDTFDAVCTRIIPPTMLYSGKEIESWQCWGKWDAARETITELLPLGQHYQDWVDYGSIIKPVTTDYYYGKPNTIEISAWQEGKSFRDLVPIATVSSGFTFDDKTSLRDEPGKWIGSVVEIAAMSVDSKALSVRHPVFVKIRPDKNPDECTLDSVFG